MPSLCVPHVTVAGLRELADDLDRFHDGGLTRTGKPTAETLRGAASLIEILQFELMKTGLGTRGQKHGSAEG